MPDYLMKFHIILLYFILMVKSSPSSLQNKKEATKLRDIAVRNFFIKEHAYLQEKPLSDEMKLFIRRCKRSNIGKSKRQYADKDHMYVVQDGDIIPLKEMAQDLSTVSFLLGDDAEEFTVIPLIVPITVKRLKIGDHGASSNEFSDNSMENISNMRGESVGMEAKADENEPPINSEVISNGKDTFSATVAAFNGRDPSLGIERAPTMKEPNIRATKSIETDDYEDETVVDNDDTTKNPEYLNRVIEDVQELITHEQEAHHSNDGALCNVIGDWDSDAAGMQIRIEKKEHYGLVYTLLEREPAMEDGFLCNGLWDISGQVPYNHSSLIVLTAVSKKNKKVASFIGECRICDGCESISGNWMVGRSSKNCKDRQETHTFFSDVLRKNNVRKLHEAHLREISPEPPTLPTPASP